MAIRFTLPIWILLIVLSLPLQQSCAQISPCPANTEKAEKKLKEYLSQEIRIQSLRDQNDMAINDKTKDNIKSLSGAENKQECRELRSNLDWLENEKHYSFYKVTNHYFIVLYTFTKDGNFQIKSIPIINSEYKALGSIIFPDSSQ